MSWCNREVYGKGKECRKGGIVIAVLWEEAARNLEERALQIYQEQGLERAVEYIKKVIEKDPDFLICLALINLANKPIKKEKLWLINNTRRQNGLRDLTEIKEEFL